jgi:DNA processing protein
MSATADAYWLALRRVHGAGPRTCRLLLERFGSAEQIFKATEDQIAAAGVGRKVAGSIAGFRDFAPLEKELCELPRLGARLVRWTDDEYPPNLKQIADPPPYLVARPARAQRHCLRGGGRCAHGQRSRAADGSAAGL